MSATEVQADGTGEHIVRDVGTERELSKDKIFHLLQTPRRRLVLRYLKERDDVVEMRDLAEQVAAWENDTTVQALTSNERQRVYIPLYQSHLPKLDDEGIIEYDQSRGTITRTELANQLDQYLDIGTESDDEADVDQEIPWESYYAGVSVIGTALIVATALGVPVLAALPSGVIGGSIVAMFALVTFFQFTSTETPR